MEGKTPGKCIENNIRIILGYLWKSLLYRNLKIFSTNKKSQESAVIDKEGLAAAKQEIDFLRLFSMFSALLTLTE